jgi:hypothetical protein
MQKALVIVLFLCQSICRLSAQVADSYYLPANASYNQKIPTPRQYFGFQVGEWHIEHEQLLGYLRKLSESSDRFQMVEYGRTYEQRPLMLFTVSSAKNLANIEKLKEQHRQLTDPKQSDKLDTRNMPAVVWLGYSVHGNEASGTNAVPMVAYYLAAAQGAEVDSLLNESIILIDPRINADGGERFATWVNTNRGQNLVSDPNSRELNEIWPGGRTNHYWFDLNRDWLYQQHPESKGRLQKFHEWKPNILTDHHEMGSGSTFFFQPGILSRVNPNTPKKNQELTAKIGNFHAAALDQIKSLYFTQEGYDDFYYGKGSTYPDAQGCIGILFEQASSRGHLQETSNGLLSFPFTIRNQVTASFSTLKAARALRVELLNWQREVFKEPNTSAAQAYVFGGSNDPVRTWEMLNILKNNQIEVYQLAKDENIDGRTFEKNNSYVVPLSQPLHRLIKGTFEKRTTFEDSLFYDISAWSMPLCFNVPFAESKNNITTGTKVSDNPFPKGKLIGKSEYAYVFKWTGYFASRTALDLMRRGFRLKVATQAFKGVLENGQTHDFDNGTVEIALGQNSQVSSEQLRNILQTIADRDGTDFYGIQTGLTPSGIDLGSSYFSTLRTPKVLMVTGDGVDANDAGEIWHLLDTRVGLPLSMANVADVNSRLSLEKYTTIILSNGNYSLNADKIKTFVQNGGTIVAMGNSVEWAANNGLLPVKIKKLTDSTSTPRPYNSIEKYRGAAQIPGSIFLANIDPTHPLCYGYQDKTLNVFKDNTIFLEKLKDPYNAPLIYTDSPLVSGYATDRHKKAMKNTPSVVATSLGAGKVIGMIDNPNFRAFWYGTNKLFLNALFFSPQILAGIRGGDE